jgi:acetyl-CoA synthetase
VQPTTQQWFERWRFDHTAIGAENLHQTSTGNEPAAWLPTDSYRERSRLRAFYERQGLGALEDLTWWAVEDIGRYWDAVVTELGLAFDPPYGNPLDLEQGAPWPKWFVGGGLNYVSAALDRWIDAGDGDRIAVHWEGDDGEHRALTFQELRDETMAFAGALRSLGIRKGDRVGIFMPMVPETVVAVFAVGAIGAVFTPMFSGYGPEAVASRLRDCEARALITADGFYRRGQTIDMKEIADRALAEAPTVEACVVLQRAGQPVSWDGERDRWWHDVVRTATPIVAVESTASNDPFMIIYTSGTTGRPKGAVHVHAGFPVKAAHDMAFCFDVGDDDTVFWLTDLGWMMGPWLICGGLLLGATIVLFEGTPDFPAPDRLWKVAERTRATVLGVAPTAIRSLMARGDEWAGTADLSRLRVLGSTGEAWNPGPWHWFFEQIGKGRLPIINYSGGTETSGGIVGGTTLQSIKPCGFTGPVPGMDADVVDDSGAPVRGAVGELVVRQPWVGMTLGFWRDPDRYLETYWSRFPGIWFHGDWAEIDDDGCWFIRGRSDDTLKVAGKRVGPAEVESAAVAHPSVQEAAAIGVPDDIKGESIVTFVVLRSGVESGAHLAEDIRKTIASQLGSALRPARIEFVRDLPRTRNAKIMRRVIRAAYLGMPAGDTTALENPDAVEVVSECGRARQEMRS